MIPKSLLYGTIIIGAFLSLVFINSAYPSFAEAVITTFKFKTLSIAGFGSLTNGTDKITINNQEPTLTNWTLQWNVTNSVLNGQDQVIFDEKNNVFYIISSTTNNFLAMNLSTGALISDYGTINTLSNTGINQAPSSLLGKYVAVSTSTTQGQIYSNGTLLFQTSSFTNGFSSESISQDGKYFLVEQNTAAGNGQLLLYKGS